MQTYAMIYTLPFVAALIGWITNYLAVRMLFRPRRPRRFLFYTWQGVFPKRQAEIAKRISLIVANELVSSSDIEQRLQETLKSAELRSSIEDHIHNTINEKLRSFLPLPQRLLDTVNERIRRVYSAELDVLMSRIVHRVAERSDAILDVRQLVEERVANFSLEKLEAIAQAVMRKEFRFIELTGGVLGFLVGAFQLAMIMLFGQ